jgi:parallel beta-helix repeat protein
VGERFVLQGELNATCSHLTVANNVGRTSAAFVLAVLVASVFIVCISFGEAETNGVVLIDFDGNVSGTDKIVRNGGSYTLVGDLSGSVRNGNYYLNILKDNIIFDGAGHKISGSGTGIAIQLEGISNVTVHNIVVDNFGDGIDVTYARLVSDNGTFSTRNSFGNIIVNNTFTTTYWGIALRDAFNTSVAGNTVNSLSNKYGVNVLSSHNNSLINNKVVGGSYIVEDSSQNTYTNNLVNGRLFAYIEGASDQVIENAGEVFLISCNNMTVRGAGSSDDLRVAVQLAGTNNSLITQCSGRINLVNSHFNEISGNKLVNIDSNVYGVSGAICLSSSNSCRVLNNEISAANGYCIYLEWSNDNVVNSNRLSSTSGMAIELKAAKFNHVCGNTVAESACGVELSYVQYATNPAPSTNPTSDNNLVYANNITDCTVAVSLKSAYNNAVYENNIAKSSNQAVTFFCSDDNSFYHNNFIDNQQNAYETHTFHFGLGESSYYSKNNTWDDGYPSGGNFWGSYTGVDQDGDGIGDTPFNVFENQTDRYPLMKAYTQGAIDLPASTTSPTPNPTTSTTPNSSENRVSPNPTTSPSAKSENPTQTATPSPTPDSAIAHTTEQSSNQTTLYIVGIAAALGIAAVVIGVFLVRRKP